MSAASGTTAGPHSSVPPFIGVGSAHAGEASSGGLVLPPMGMHHQPLLRVTTVTAIKAFLDELVTYVLNLEARGQKCPALISMITPEAMDAMPLFLKSIGIKHDLPSWQVALNMAMGRDTSATALWEETLNKAFTAVRLGTCDSIEEISDEEAEKRVKKRARWTIAAGSFDTIYNNFQQGWYAAMRLDGLRGIYYGTQGKEKAAAKLLCSMLYPPKFRSMVETRAKRGDRLKNPDQFLEYLLECKSLFAAFEGATPPAAVSKSIGAAKPKVNGGSKVSKPFTPRKTNDFSSTIGGGAGGPSRTSGSMVSRSFSSVKCYGCGQMGHKRPDCPTAAGSAVSGRKGVGNAVTAVESKATQPRRPVGKVIIAGVEADFCLDSGASSIYVADQIGRKIATHERVEDGTVLVEKFKTPLDLTIAEEASVLQAHYRITAPASLLFTRSKKRVDIKKVVCIVVKGLVEEVLFGNEFIEKTLKINLEDLLHSNEFVKVSKIEEASKAGSLQAMLAEAKEFDEDGDIEEADVMDLLAGSNIIDHTSEELQGKVQRIVERKAEEGVPTPMNQHDPVAVQVKLEKALQDAADNGMSAHNVERLRKYLFSPSESSTESAVCPSASSTVESVGESVRVAVSSVDAPESVRVESVLERGAEGRAEAFLFPEVNDGFEPLRDEIKYILEDRSVAPVSHIKVLRGFTLTPADAFRLTLSNDPPAKVPPVEEEMKPSVYDIRYYQRKYSVIDSEFMARKMDELEWADLVYLNRKARVISPALPVRKAGADPKGSIMDQLRLAIDLRAVNQHTVQLYWPSPSMETFPSRAAGKKYFAVLDMKDGFWLLALHPNTQRFFSIGTDRGVWTSKRMLHGARNATAHYQAAMDSVLRDLIDNNDCIVYVDDILVMGETQDKLVDILIKVIDRLWAAGFKISAKKTVFLAREVKFCGRIYSASGVRFDPKSVETLVKMKPPTDAKELRSYLCTANWFRLAIPRFNETVAPLQELLKLALQESRSRGRKTLLGLKLDELGWSEVHVKAFAAVNNALANAVELAYPPKDDKHKVCVFVDASKYHWAGVVTCVEVAELEKPYLEQCHMPLAFVSGSFAGAMLKWPTVEKEAYSLREVCDRESHILRRPGGFLAFTDHRNLVFLFSNASEAADGRKQAEERLERWMVFMRGFDYELIYIPGELNVCADMISRFAAPGLDMQSDEVATEMRAFVAVTRQQSQAKKVGVVAAPPLAVTVGVAESTPAVRASRDVVTAKAVPATAVRQFNPGNVAQFSIDDVPSEDELRTAQELAFRKDSATVLAERAALKLQLATDGLWRAESGQVWLPDKHCVRVRVCIAAHQGLGGHRASETTLSRIKEMFTWRGMRGDVVSYCRSCLQCMAVRGGGTIPRPLLGTMKASQPNELLCFDYYYVQAAPSGVPDAEVYVLVLRDAFSRYTWLVPCKRADAETTAKALLNWFAAFGIVHKWTSDRGSHFCNEVVRRVGEVIGVDHHFTTPYAPWANGVVERANKELKELLAMLLAESLLPDHEWVRVLPVVQSVINNTKSDVLGGHAPVEVMCGLRSQTPLQVVFYPEEKRVVSLSLTSEEVKQSVTRWLQSVQQVRAAVAAVPARGARSVVGERPVDFGVGDYVLVSSAARPGGSKLHPRWLGPALVVERVNANAFKVVDVLEVESGGEPRQVHAAHLKRYANHDLWLSEHLRDHAAYAGFGYRVESFVNHRLKDGVWELCAKWVGYSLDEVSWKSIEEWFEEVPVMVRRYVKTVEARQEREELTTLLKSLE